MVPMKLVLALSILLCSGINSFAYRLHPLYLLDEPNFLEETIDDRFSGHSHESFQPNRVRLARQVVSGTENPDGSKGVSVKVPIAGNDKNDLSAHGFINGLKKDGTIDSAGGGLALDNVKGHKLSLTGTHNVNSGDELTAEGRLKLLNTPNHELDANAFITKHFSKNPLSPDFTTRGGSLDYTYRDRNGLSLSITQDSLSGDQLTAEGRLNLLNTPNHELDANAFITKHFSKDPLSPDFTTREGSLDYTYKDRNGLSLSMTQDSLSGDQLTAAGRLNLLNTPNHELDANAFVTRIMPNNPFKPDYNTYGGNLDYLYKDKLGASVGVVHTPEWMQTDYSARGNLNLYRNPTTSLDLYSQLTKSHSSFQPESPLKSDFGVTFRKSW